MITQYLQALQHEVTEVRILRSERYLCQTHCQGERRTQNSKKVV